MSLTLVQSRWQGWIVRSRCCHRHHRKIQTIVRLSPPAVFTSALLVERRRGLCRCEEDHQDAEEEAAEPGRDVAVADIGRARRRGRCCCCCCRQPRPATTAGLSPEKRPPGRRRSRFACPLHGHRGRRRRSKEAGERPRPRRGAPRARRTTLVSFVLSLPSDVFYDPCRPLAGTADAPCPRWIVTLTGQ